MKYAKAPEKEVQIVLSEKITRNKEF